MQLALSVLKPVAEAFGLHAYQEVAVRKVGAASHAMPGQAMSGHRASQTNRSIDRSIDRLLGFILLLLLLFLLLFYLLTTTATATPSPHPHTHPAPQRQVDPAAARVDFVEFTFKDDFISRADMWRFKKKVYGRAAYVGACVHASVRACERACVGCVKSELGLIDGHGPPRCLVPSLSTSPDQIDWHASSPSPPRPPTPHHPAPSITPQASTSTCWASARA